jgi:hypothetical protein
MEIILLFYVDHKKVHIAVVRREFENPLSRNYTVGWEISSV